MVYKKYIKRGSKVYGPYYCESYRAKDGKVKTRFISKTKPLRKKSKNVGKRPKKSLNKIWTLSGFVFLIVLLLVLGNVNYGMSGRVVEDITASTGDRIVASQINERELVSSIDIRNEMEVDIKDSFGNEGMSEVRSVRVGSSPASLVSVPTTNVTYGGGVADTPSDFVVSKPQMNIGFGGGDSGGSWEGSVETTRKRSLVSVTLKNTKSVPIKFDVELSKNLRRYLKIVEDSFILKPGEEKEIEVVLDGEDSQEVFSSLNSGGSSSDLDKQDILKVLEGTSGYIEIKSGIQVKQIPVTFTSKTEEVQVGVLDGDIERDNSNLYCWDLLTKMIVVVLILGMVGIILFRFRKRLGKNWKKLGKN